MREQLTLSRTEAETMERRAYLLQKADIQKQRKILLDERDMEKKVQELHKAQFLQVRIYLIMA